MPLIEGVDGGENENSGRSKNSRGEYEKRKEKKEVKQKRRLFLKFLAAPSRDSDNSGRRLSITELLSANQDKGRGKQKLPEPTPRK